MVQQSSAGRSGTSEHYEVAIKGLAERFRRVAWGREPSRRGLDPGQKVQIGNGLATRTYTALDRDVSAGHVRLLGYVDGRAWAWLRVVEEHQRQ